MAVVSVAIMVSFHLKNEPSPVERRIALPIGLLFWLLSAACLANGLANYVKTVVKYGRRRALVQSGWKTQVTFTIVACAIVAVCVLFLSTNAEKE
ncbi:MAG: hypothetical protein LQ341_006526 [Variospora aurantia]|nr:MAG: hypothetical protein LQ341_006526 [Variospora aurantia]